jgi:peptidoglycan-associated lipoprotein
MKKLVLSLGLIGVFTAASACASAEKPKAARAPLQEPARVAEAPKPAVSDGGSISAGPEAPSSPIYFAFDSDQITPESQQTLAQMADYLRAHPEARLTIEGHCDETGSAEYNLALGDRRARAARDYLKRLGIDDTRLKSISYGEERPAVAGSDEAAHQQNRRGQFDLKNG